MKPTILLIKDTSLSGPDQTIEMQDLFLTQIRAAGLEGTLQVVRANDLGIYNHGLVIKMLPSGVLYGNVQKEQIAAIVDKTLKQGTIIEDLILRTPHEQMRIVLRNCGVVDPECLENYLDVDGYKGAARCLLEMTPEQVIEELKKSGLRGRGGAGYPAYLKWSLARRATGDIKYMICNADEGDPGAYMDRSVLEGDPHSVIEGMIIAGYAIGAKKGFLYVRAEYPLAIERVEKALGQAREAGLLGERILGSDFSFELEVRLGAGAFVCGEETALIASIEGKRGTPRPRPPYPSDVGLWGKPTVINNVETLANIPVILALGGDWFARIGTEKSKGTKVFAMTGKVRNSGLVEIPMGTPLSEILYGIGGGALNSEKRVIAIQTGGPSGGVIPEKHFDTPVSYEHLQGLGSIMGSGGMIVMDEDDCLVDIAKFYLGFCVDESCGKCAPCRIGGYQMLEILESITAGKGSLEGLEKLKVIATAMQRASLCGLGQTAPNPVLSTLRYFPEEYREHVENKKCRAGKCSGLLSYEILQDKCKRCRLCVNNCPAGAIPGDKEQGYTIDTVKCIQCGHCYEVCKFAAVARR